ncbi:MAG: pseudouridine synthase [Sphingobacteriaceae bacterium]|nr:pseudouridine synthase [Sphingobacteriaceae bacterium]
MNANENYGRDDRSRRTQQDANAFNEDRQARLERLQKELHTLESGSDDQKSKLISRDLDRQQNKPDFSGNRPFGRFERNDRGTDRPFNREGGRSFERRDDRGGDRPSFNREGRPPFERRDGDSRPPFERRDGDSRPPFQRRDENSGGGDFKPRTRRDDQGEGFRSRPPFQRRDDNQGDRPSFNRDSRPPFERRDDRGGDRPSFNREGGPRSFDRSDRPSGDRPAFNRDSRPPFERRDDRGGDRPSFNREGGPRNFDRSDRPSGDRPAFNRDSRPPFERRDDRGGDRPSFNREGGPRNFERPAGDRPAFNREGGPRNFERPAGDRPPFNREGGRPYERREGFAPRRDDRGGDRPAFNRSNDRNDRGTSRFGDRRAGGNRDNRSGFQAPDSRRRGRLTELDFPAKPQTIVFDQPMRLNRYIANSGICSRRRADELITAGEIFINGTAVTELGSRVQPGDVVTYAGRTLTLETLVYVLLNKPKDFITTLDDPEERRTVMNLVKNATEERIVPVGRLDRNTTGLLVLTNDGELTQKLTHPSNNIAKVYDVVLDKPLTEAHFNQIAEGVTLDDGLATVDAIAYPNPEDKCEVGVEIHSGRNRIVRRIFESLGYDVVKLDRVFYAGITKKDLPRGNWRYLTPKEITRLKSM